MKILITGATGLVGERITELLSSKYEFIPITRAHGADITNYASLVRYQDSEAEIVIHLAAKTDVDGCEKDKALGESGDAWKMNVTGTQNIIDLCMYAKKKLIFISTDFVFDGEKPEGEGYIETDAPKPLMWYAQTKYESEKLVLSSGLESVILRIAYPYRKEFEIKSDFVRAIYNRLKDGLEVKAITDHIMCPTFVDDVARVIDLIIQKNVQGLYHAAGATHITPFNAAKLVAQVFSLNADLIKPTTRAEFFKDRAPRPFNLYLKNDKIVNLGIEMSTFQKGLYNLK